MPPLDRRSKSQVDSLRQGLGRLELAAPSALPWFLPEVTRLLGADRAFAAHYSVALDHVTIDEFVAVGPQPQRLRAAIQRVLQEQRGSWDNPAMWSTWNPLRPRASERNRAVAAFREFGRRETLDARVHRDAVRPSGYGDRDQLRVIPCDGPSGVGWVGVLREEPFGPREVRLLQALVPALRQRMKFEREMRHAASSSMLVAALEAIGHPAFVIRRAGVVLHANAAGRACLDADRSGVLGALHDAAQGAGRAGYSATPVTSPDRPTEYLVVRRGLPTDPGPLVAMWSKRWSLSPRQRDVLNLAVRGSTNHRVAVTLGCAEKTIEAHVSAIFGRAQVRSRAELISVFWSGLGA